MLECPIDYYVDNLIFNRDKSCWAVFELQGYDYDMLGDESKIAILNVLVRFISNIETEGKIMIIPVSQNLDEHFSNLTKGVKPGDPLYRAAISQAAETKRYLQALSDKNGKTNDYKTFVVFKLQRAGDDDIAMMAKDALSFLVRGIINDFNAFMHVDGKDILASKISAYRKMADEFYSDQNKRLAMRPVDTQTTQWLLRRMMYRGLQKDVRLFQKSVTSDRAAWNPGSVDVELAGEKYLRPRSKEVVNLFSGTITKSGRTLHIEHDNETSYQTFLTITNIPEDLAFPNCEWIYLLQQYNIQAEIYITLKNTEHREALHKLDLQRRAAQSQMENIEKARAEIPEDLLESREAIEQIEAELKEGNSPLCNVGVVVCLSADNAEALEKKTALIKTEYEDMNFVVERPLTDQLDLFLQCIPSVGFCVSDFIIKMTPTALAAGLIGATHELGDHDGPFIGTTGTERKSVFLNLKNACLSNVSASTVFYGNLGVGKSFNANLLTYLHVIYGAYGLIVDPKGERTHWPQALTSMRGMISLVTLSPDARYAGMLDPYNIFREDVSEAGEVAVNLLTELFHLSPKDLQYTALLEAVHKMKDEQTPSMQRLADVLSEFDPGDDLYKAAGLLGRQIRLQREAGMAQLLFGDGSEQAISLNNRLNILQIQNLKLPDPTTKKEDYTNEETISTVLMMVIAAFARKFIHSHRNNFKVLLFDESWMLGKTAEGEKLMSYSARMSRSLYTAMILNGHSVTDLPNEGIRNSITYKFCFRTGNTSEAERMLDFMKLEKTKSNINLITGLGNAQCLFQDLRGRVGILKFDAVFQDLIDVFSTTPIDASTLPAAVETPAIGREAAAPESAPIRDELFLTEEAPIAGEELMDLEAAPVVDELFLPEEAPIADEELMDQEAAPPLDELLISVEAPESLPIPDALFMPEEAPTTGEAATSWNDAPTEDPVAVDRGDMKSLMLDELDEDLFAYEGR